LSTDRFRLGPFDLRLTDGKGDTPSTLSSPYSERFSGVVKCFAESNLSGMLGDAKLIPDFFRGETLQTAGDNFARRPITVRHYFIQEHCNLSSVLVTRGYLLLRVFLNRFLKSRLFSFGFIDNANESPEQICREVSHGRPAGSFLLVERGGYRRRSLLQVVHGQGGVAKHFFGVWKSARSNFVRNGQDGGINGSAESVYCVQEKSGGPVSPRISTHGFDLFPPLGLLCVLMRDGGGKVSFREK
jgi:hypothetical protein